MNEKPDTPIYATLQDAAAFFQVHRNTLSRWVREKPGFPQPRSMVDEGRGFFLWAELVAYRDRRNHMPVRPSRHRRGRAPKAKEPASPAGSDFDHFSVPLTTGIKLQQPASA